MTTTWRPALTTYKPSDAYGYPMPFLRAFTIQPPLETETMKPKKMTKKQIAHHRKTLRKLSKQPFVMVTHKTLPYIEHLPPNTVLRAHKLIAGDMGPSYYRRASCGIPTYSPGSTHSVSNANTSSTRPCGAGLNVGTLEWITHCYEAEVCCIGNTDLLAVVEFTRNDVAALPIVNRQVTLGTRGKYEWRPGVAGKFRLHRLKVLSVSVLDPEFMAQQRISLRDTHTLRLKYKAATSVLDPAIFAKRTKKAVV